MNTVNKTSNPHARKIIEYIRSHKLVPGDPIPSESVLTEELGISRSALREAIRELRALQIIDVHQGNGSFVGEASLTFLSQILVFRTLAPGEDLVKKIMELISTRKILELGLSEQLVGRLSQSQLDRLRECCRKMGLFTDNTDLDREFHSILYEQVDNEIIKQLISAFWEAFAQIKAGIPYEKPSKTRDIHEAIVNAYESGESKRVIAAMTKHFNYIEHRLQQLNI